MAKRALGRIVNVGGDTVIFRDNSKEVLAALDDANTKTLTEIGLKAEGYAKKLCPVGTPESTKKDGYKGGTLRNSITFVVDAIARVLRLGTNIEYGPFVELGTGPHFRPPPEWEHFEAERGKGVGRAYVHPRPFVRPAFEDHISEYERLWKSNLKG